MRFLALTLLACPALAGGQGTGIIRGRISDAATGAPLAGVSVRVDDGSVTRIKAPEIAFWWRDQERVPVDEFPAA